MKKLLLFTALAAVMSQTAVAETVTLSGKDYEMTTLIDRQLGPGVHYTRFRIPSYPLNINLLRIDVANQYNSIETTQASDKLYGTESLVKAAARQSSDGHQALAGANANFWCVSNQPPYSDQLIGVTYNGNLRNGKIITETNMTNDQWNGGYKHTGITGITSDGRALSGNFMWVGTITSDATGEAQFNSANKLVRDEEISIYNSYYGTSRTFRCVNQVTGSNGKQTFEIIPACATEVYLTLDPGQQWSAGNPISFTVAEVKTDAGDGTLGSYDLAVVGRGSKKELLARLKAGDKLSLKYTWTTTAGDPVRFENLVGGNAQVMVNGELTKYNTSETYNSQVYSRTGYGTDADGKTLYIMVIDKATDPVYGSSAGCSTTIMCELLKSLGCVNVTNFDAGGSAEMLVNGAIINTTTEGSPRAVANGMIVYNTAPEDNTIARLAFNDYALKAPVYSSYSPVVLGYNQYGTLIDDNVDVTLSCPPQAGTCDGGVFTAGNTPGVYQLTATYGDISVSAPITVADGQMAIRLKPILIDAARQYPIEVTADVDGKTYTYNPANITWTLGDEAIAAVDAQGVLTGLKNGQTTLTATLGDFTDNTTVDVQIADSPAKPVDNWASWTAKGLTGITSSTITKEGSSMTFTYAKNGRNPQLTLTPAENYVFFSLPDRISFTFSASIPVASVAVNIHNRLLDRPAAITVKPESQDTWEANTEHTILIPFPTDATDLMTYPLEARKITVTFDKNNDYAGKQSLNIKEVAAHYDNYIQGVDNITVDGPGTNDPNAPVIYYNLQGVKVSPANITPGLYIVVRGNKASKMLLR